AVTGKRRDRSVDLSAAATTATAAGVGNILAVPGTHRLEGAAVSAAVKPAGPQNSIIDGAAAAAGTHVHADLGAAVAARTAAPAATIERGRGRARLAAAVATEAAAATTAGASVGPAGPACRAVALERRVLDEQRGLVNIDRAACAKAAPTAVGAVAALGTEALDGEDADEEREGGSRNDQRAEGRPTRAMDD